MEFLIESCAHRVADDPIFALNAEAAARASRGESIINATVGALLNDDGSLAILPTVARVLREVPAATAAAYAPIAGSREFRTSVVEELFGDEHRVLLDNAIAVATPGGTGALHHAVCDFLDVGDALLTTSHYWAPYHTIATENRRRVETFEMFDALGNFNLGGLGERVHEHLKKQGRAVLFINDPCHNPTGYSLSEDDWGGLVALLRSAALLGPVTALFDVAYYLYASGNPRAFLQRLLPLVGEVQIAFAWSGSKSYAQYGARLGALIVVDPDAARRTRAANALGYSCRGTWSNCNHGVMLAFTRIVQDREVRAAVDAERTTMLTLLRRRVDVFNEAAKTTRLRYPRYQGGFFSTVFPPKGRDPLAIAAALRERGVFVVPQGDGLRVALCAVAERSIPRLVDELATAIDQASAR